VEIPAELNPIYIQAGRLAGARSPLDQLAGSDVSW
jgi:hypothetical protein